MNLCSVHLPGVSAAGLARTLPTVPARRPHLPRTGQLTGKGRRMMNCTVQFTARHGGNAKCTVQLAIGDLRRAIAPCNSRPGIGGRPIAPCISQSEASGGQLHGAALNRRPPAANCTVHGTTPTPKPANKTHLYEDTYMGFWRTLGRSECRLVGSKLYSGTRRPRLHPPASSTRSRSTNN